MSQFKCFIIDDEPLAIDVLVAHLKKLPQFEIAGKFTEPLLAFSKLKTEQVDLLFLDIEMPDINGLELIKILQQKPEIIITTAYREFAVEGFELDVLDYLVKPIAFDRFLKAIDKFQNKVGPKVTATFSPEESHEYIVVRADRKHLKISLNNIKYVEGLKDYVKIFLEDGEIFTKMSIGNFEHLLPSDQFIRVHKSFIVAKNKITAYTAFDVEIGEKEIPISRTYKELFRLTMKKSF
ncbi:LytTR family DNA-binding domain-containing protein [Fulvivirgaceae bacterium BMA10]|uniref:LytTR family DNA-binding domain-containing protein n=1 Tax=Splendidivirga corallicola TaxID=3051826 RepID=A0ABT8KQS1_9BACT|nr:LytTR family DNA-binding domain-containing protein [Fulvivirgaceae bacterium BMA10]